MVYQCITVNMQQPATITIQSITVDGTPCTTCDVVCTGGTCPSDITVVTTWANAGDLDGVFTPTITVDTFPTIGIPVTVPAGLTATSTFTVMGLSQGSHNICVDSGTIT